MDCQLEILNPADFKNWDDLVLATPGYSFFHSSNWAAVLQESYGYKPLYFSQVDSGQLRSLIPLMEVRSILTGKRAVSLPFTDYCEPIVTEEYDLQKIKTAIENYAAEAGLKYVEIRGGGRISDTQKPSETFYRHVLPLSNDEKSIFANFRNSTKRNIKKASKEGVEFKISQSFESLKEFYRLNCLTRKGHGLPPQPFHFFEKVYQQVISKNLGMIVTGVYQHKIIAAAVYFHFGTKAIYKYGASDKSYQHLRANNLVMWQAIKWYARNGYENICFGRTELNHSGLRQFKIGWGTEEKMIKYYKYDIAREKYIQESSRTGASYNRFMTRMPIPMLKLAGTLLYKHMG